MDSCVCATLAARNTDAAALHISYGQRTEAREREAFLAICARLGIRNQLVVRNEALRAIGGSALTDPNLAVPDAPAEFAPHARPVPITPRPITPVPITPIPITYVPITYVPFRNAHFLAVAVSWAEVLGAEQIYIGAVEQDSSGYPDCRPAYYEAYNQVIRTGTKAGPTGEGQIRIVTPLIALKKSQIIRQGLELGAPFDLTWSCYSREDTACGRCDSCALRRRAFAEAGAADPIPYEPQPHEKKGVAPHAEL